MRNKLEGVARFSSFNQLRIELVEFLLVLRKFAVESVEFVARRFVLLVKHRSNAAPLLVVLRVVQTPDALVHSVCVTSHDYNF